MSGKVSNLLVVTVEVVLKEAGGGKECGQSVEGMRV